MTAHVADPLDAIHEAREPVLEMAANRAYVGEQLLLLDHVEHRAAHGGLQRRGGRRVEVERVGVEVVRDVSAGPDPGERQARAHGLAHRDDVRDAVHHLVTPPTARTAEAGLDLVEDHDPAGAAHQRRGFRHEPGRNVRQPFVGEDRAEQHAGEGHAVRLEALDGPLDFRQVQVAALRFRGPLLDGAIRLRKGHPPEVRFEGTDRHPEHFRAVAVVGGVAADDPVTAGEQPRHPERHLDGLGSRAAHLQHRERVAVELHEPL